MKQFLILFLFFSAISTGLAQSQEIGFFEYHGVGTSGNPDLYRSLLEPIILPNGSEMRSHEDIDDWARGLSTSEEFCAMVPEFERAIMEHRTIRMLGHLQALIELEVLSFSFNTNNGEVQCVIAASAHSSWTMCRDICQRPVARNSNTQSASTEPAGILGNSAL